MLIVEVIFKLKNLDKSGLSVFKHAKCTNAPANIVDTALSGHSSVNYGFIINAAWQNTM